MREGIHHRDTEAQRRTEKSLPPEKLVSVPLCVSVSLW
jgi:hypothetical protein